MRHYEIVVLVHPDQSENVGAMVERYRNHVEGADGVIHRIEDWGRRQLAYPIEKIHKAHYFLMNIESNQETIDELKNMFKFSDAVIRNLVIRKSRADTDPSPLARSSEEAQESEVREGRRESDRSSSERVAVEDDGKAAAGPDIETDAGNTDKQALSSQDEAQTQATESSALAEAETSDDSKSGEN